MTTACPPGPAGVRSGEPGSRALGSQPPQAFPWTQPLSLPRTGILNWGHRAESRQFWAKTQVSTQWVIPKDMFPPKG